ncbi:MAG: DNA polymerase IV [Candidatus Micrarchaeota archaeon]|nr:DNA polymerase IV [Candidatus Micrarchaeota archaeon]
MQRIIFHIDFDYFYAQVEETDNPKLKDRPIVVCMFSGRTEDSGAVATSNYVARGYGVKSGMPIAFAKKKLEDKNAIFIKARHERYAEVSQQLMMVIASYADKFEQTSIDEAFIDVSKRIENKYVKARQLAEELKKEIFENYHFTCSIGIGPNKLIAKISSDIQKPNGLTIVRPPEVETFLGILDVDKIPGVGPKTKEALNMLGIKTVADLHKYNRTEIAEKFGKNTGAWLIKAANGEDDSEVAMVEEQKQLSRIKTLKRNSREIGYIMTEIDELINDVAQTLKDNNLVCTIVGINAIDSELKNYTKSKTLVRATNDVSEIKNLIRELYRSLLETTFVEFRRTGVKVEKFESKAGQKTLGEF